MEDEGKNTKNQYIIVSEATNGDLVVSRGMNVLRESYIFNRDSTLRASKRFILGCHGLSKKSLEYAEKLGNLDGEPFSGVRNSVDGLVGAIKEEEGIE